MTTANDLLADFIRAACVPRNETHVAGTLDEADAILAAHPEVARGSIHAAAILGDDATVREFLAADAESASATGGPYDWDPLTHLCFSRYLRLDRSRSEGFVRAATALLDAGASATTGWLETEHMPHGVWESALYGAAGVAHHAELTRLLLDRGADPNDEETPYHAPEGYDNAALEALLDSGKLSDDSLAAMLVRKADWHDHDGIALLLTRGADPNRVTPWGVTALHQAVRRDNALRNIELMLDHGADPTLKTTSDARSAMSIAARRGRGDVLDLFERRGIPVELRGVERLIAACARDRTAEVRAIAEREPELVRELPTEGGTLLAEFSGVGNTEGVRHLLDLGVDAGALYGGNPYFGIPRDSTALHVAAWLARHATVRFLIERGAPVNAKDGNGQTPLALAVRACVDSYWTERRSPESVDALLRAGASASGVGYPSGYAEVDALLASHGRR